MNALVAKMLGEANFHSPEERAGLGQHGETDSGNSEEAKEVQLAQQILAAIKSKDTNSAIRAASQLIRMHQPQAAGYSKQMSLMTGVPSQSFPSSP